MSNTSAITYALLGGILPALLWLMFWLREDSKRPEPKGRLIQTFLAGMLAVLLVIPFQKHVSTYFPGYVFMAFLLWAIFEEVFKLVAAYIAGISTLDDDEPIDALVYMITAALGFVALENTLFILSALRNTDLISLNQNVSTAISTGGLRFIGASLLHVVSSGTIGLFLSLAFYKSKSRKVAYTLLGLLLSIVFHTAFNLFILEQRGSEVLYTLSTVWFGIAILLLFFEKVKAIAPR